MSLDDMVIEGVVRTKLWHGKMLRGLVSPYLRFSVVQVFRFLGEFSKMPLDG